MSTRANVQDLIAVECDSVRQTLLAKNLAYGNSVCDPVGVFSKLSAVERINVRIDDKLSRIGRGLDAGEDTELDLIGYLILKRVLRKLP